MWIMIAGPFRENAVNQQQCDENLKHLNEIAYKVFDLGHVPIIGVNMAMPIIKAMGDEYLDEIIMPLSLALVDRCDAILRIDGESRCADMELERFKHQDKQIFTSLDQIPSEG